MAVAGLAAGCSADMSRFDDGFYTGSVPQAIPQAGAARLPGAGGSVDQMSTGSVRPGVLGSNPGAGVQQTYGQNGGYSLPAPVRTASVERNMLPPPGGAQPAMMAPARSAEPAPMPAATSQPVAMAPARPAKAGWSDTGNRVALRAGETVDTLADRYGVPAKAILAVNGLRSASEAQPGQQLAIPTYSYGGNGSQAPVMATGPNGQTLGAPPSNLRVPSSAPAQSMAAAAPVRAAGKGGSLVVESGDSVLGLARRNGVSAAALREANGLTDDNIRIGQTLVLPSGATPAKRVASLETKPTMTDAKPVAVKPVKVEPAPVAKAEPKPYEAPRAVEASKPAEEQKPAKAEAAKAEPAPEPKTPDVAAAPAAPTSTVEDEVDTEVASAAPTATGIDQFRWPVQGRVVKRFGEKSGARRNDGLDISVPRGTPIKAAENGVVIYAGDGLKEFGNTVLVKHANGLVTVYGHADDLKVKRGATVKRGQEIATAGMTGDTETPQVHFEVRKDSAPVDPMKFLR